MKFIRLGLGTLAFMSLFASASFATASHTFVSGTGSDSNASTACTQAAPCRSFTAALAQTSNQGVITALDDGDYAPFTISIGVTIDAPQGATITVPLGQTAVGSGNGIIIATGSALLGSSVTLRGLTINGGGWQGLSGPGGNIGINDESGQSLLVENCDVNGFQTAIMLQFGLTDIRNTVVRDSNIGIELSATNGRFCQAVIDHVTSTDNHGYGVLVYTTGGSQFQAEIRDSVISGFSASTGISVQGFSQSKSIVDVKDCAITNGFEGVQTITDGVGFADISISNCLISHNSNAGFTISGGGIVTFGDNKIIGNGPNTGTLSSFGTQ
jgi:hypothetical protein